jgi:hypothetical protein
MIPGIVRFVDQLPKGATGKIVKGDIDCSNPGRCLLDGDVGCLCSYFGQDRISQKAIPNRNPQRRLSPDIRRDVHHFSAPSTTNSGRFSRISSNGSHTTAPREAGRAEPPAAREFSHRLYADDHHTRPRACNPAEKTCSNYQ